MILRSEIDLNEDLLANTDVNETLTKWFYRTKRLEKGCFITGAFEIRLLNSFEEEMFGLDTGAFKKM